MAGGTNDPTSPAPPVVPKPSFTAPVNTTPAAPVPPVETSPSPPPEPLELEPDAALAQRTGDALAPSTPAKQAYFCLEANHPGRSTPRADHFDLERMFYATDKGAPTCPMCRKQVSAIPVDDTTKLPPSLQATADRLAVAERQR